MKKYLALLSVIAMVNVASAHDESYHDHGHHHHHSHSWCGNQICDDTHGHSDDGHHHHHHGNVCATLYKYSGFSGPSLRIYDNSQISSLAQVSNRSSSYWNNEVTSLVVNRGCTLKVYQYNNFGIHYRTGEQIGLSRTYFGYDTDYRLNRLDEKISSLTCSCN